MAPGYAPLPQTLPSAPHEHDQAPLHSRTHVPALDGIRGVAILLVFVYHTVLFGHIRPITAVDRVLSMIGEAGWAGVDLFFVLSGFLITGILYDAKGHAGYFRNFYARRILRIFPLYYAVLCVLFIVIPRLAPSDYLSPLVKDQIWHWTYLSNVSIALQGWHPVSELNHFWSLAVEEQFYLVWPWVVFALDRGALMRTCLGMVAGSFGVRVALHAMGQPLATTVLTLTRMDGLALGALVALAAREPGGLLRLNSRLRVAAVSSAALLGLLFVVRGGLKLNDPMVSTFGFTLFALLFAGTLSRVLIATRESIVARLLAHRFLQSLGRYSYALYVFHLPVIFWLGRRLSLSFVPTLAGSNLPSQLVFTVLAGCISLAAALLSWHLYEAQFLKLKALFPYDTSARSG